MNQSSYTVNSKLLPAGFPREFDAHIYFETNEFEKAQKLRDKMKLAFAEIKFFVGDMIIDPIGPHPLPMFEANFPTEHFSEVVLWLMKERDGLNILVHPLTADDYEDHTKSAMWLGKSVELKLSVFELN